MTTTRVRRRGPGSRAGKHHPTRQEIVEAALALADEDGLAALSVEAVTRAAGHAKGTFYVHFDDRTELLVALHDRFHDEVFEGIRDTTLGLPAGPDRARTRIIAFLDACRRQPGVRAMLRDASEREPEAMRNLFKVAPPDKSAAAQKRTGNLAELAAELASAKGLASASANGAPVSATTASSPADAASLERKPLLAADDDDERSML